MCGIVGWLNVEMPSAEATNVLSRMCDAIKYRGPDDRGVFIGERVVLGMQRLSIVDIGGGHQPMASDDGQIQIVFNGEIYNHEELRDRLRSRGASFKTRSDTEVILRTYELDGIDGFTTFNGMFSIAVWDGRRQALSLVRDRLGVKPLYYARVGTSLVFGSEIKAILASDLVQRAVNRRAIWDYLTYRYVPSPETIWQNIYKLPPAHRLTVVAGTEPVIERWWDPPIREQQSGVDVFDYDAEFAALFDNAVDIRMVADVPVGILLSGGLDSSAVAAAASRNGAHVETFSVAFEGGSDIDERAYARQVAGHLQTRHHEVVIGQREFVDFLPDFVRFSDEPLADLASIPLYHVSKLARGSVKVVLSGEGSDEVFGGYTFDRWVEKWERAQNSRAGMAGALAHSPFGGALGRISPTIAALRNESSVETDLRRLPEPLTMTNLASSGDKRSWLRGNSDYADSLDIARQALARIGKQNPLNQALYVYCQDWLVEDLLMKADRMSMACSLELRTPFLDYRLVEWAWRLPTQWKVGTEANGERVTKRILRRYARTRLPAAIIDRPKLGFPVPVYGWISGELAGWARDMLGPKAHVREWLHDEAIDNLLERGIAVDADMTARHRLWNVLILEQWAQQWLN